MVKILGFYYHGPGSVPGRGTEIPHGLAKKKKKRLPFLETTKYTRVLREDV